MMNYTCPYCGTKDKITYLYEYIREMEKRYLIPHIFERIMGTQPSKKHIYICQTCNNKW